MRCYVEFITTPTADTPGTLLLLHFDDGRYLIGRPGEGTQRACIQRGIGLRKVTDILLTGWTKWENLGGMLGMVLNLADIKGAATEALANHEKVQSEKRQQQSRAQVVAKQKMDDAQEQTPLRFYGAPNLNHLIGTARRFIFRTGMPLATTEYKGDAKTSETWEPTWTDKRVRVWAMSITPSSTDIIAERSPGSPRKRTFDEISADVDQTGDEYDSMRRNVVNKMFGSSWRYDALVPMPLSRVKMPATVYVRDPSTKQTVPYTGPLPGDSDYSSSAETTVLVREPWPGALTEFLPPTNPSKDAVSYIIRNHPQRGKFMPEKAKTLNIQPLSKWNDLANGHSVVNLDGKLITPDMVLQPGKEGGGFAVVDLPTVEHIKPLIERREWKAKEVMDGVGAIVWILGPGLSTDKSLVAFQNAMSDIEHVVASPDCCPDILAIDSAARSVLRYNKVDSNIFPSLQHSMTPKAELAGGKPVPNVEGAVGAPGIMAATRGLRIGLEPIMGLEYDKIQPPLDIVQTEKGLSEDLEPLLRNPALNVSPSEEDVAKWVEMIQHDDVEITTLGTGSSHPSTHRNVSGTLVRVPSNGSYLLDAGEGTLGTLKRVFSPEELRGIFKDLRVIWISHLHADHHLGLASVIKAWYQAVYDSIPAPTPSALNVIVAMEQESPLAVISDAPMLHWLAEYSSIEDFGYSRILPLATIPCKYPTQMDHHKTRTTLHVAYGTHQSNPTNDPAVSNPLVLPKLGLQTLETTYVDHCKGAQGISMTTSSGFKFSYSGDCRPNADLAAIGAGSHVLIHEATFEEQMRNEALAKRHSTADEALIVATKMKANLCLLTHFSQRYPTMPSWGTPKARLARTSSPTRTPPAIEPTDPMDIDNVPSSATASAAGIQRWPGSGAYSRSLSPEYESLVKSGNIRKTVAASGMRVITAFDYMRFKMRDVPRLEAKQPLLKEVCDLVASKDDDGTGDNLSDDAGESSQSAARKATEKKAQKQAKQAKTRNNQAKNIAKKEETSKKWKQATRAIVKGSRASPTAVEGGDELRKKKNVGSF